MTFTPSLPTDNLYKFIALCGLVLCIASAAGQQHQILDSRSRMREYSFQIADFDGEVHVLLAHYKRLGRVAKPSSADLAAIDSLNDRIERLNASIAARRKAIDEMGDDDAFEWRFMFAGGLLGFLTAAVGFGLWYDRLQRYQDLSVRAQADATRPSGAAPPE